MALHQTSGVDAVSPAWSALLRAALLAGGSGAPRPAGACGRRAVIVHLDGVSHRALEEAMRGGRMPFLTRLLDQGTSTCTRYRVGAPASTSAFQAGLLYGKVDDVPGYLWYDKRTRRGVRMDDPEDVERVERRHSLHERGLLAGGVSYTTLFTGGASVPAMNLAHLKKLDWRSNSRHWPLPLAAGVHGLLGAKLWSRLAPAALRDLAECACAAARVGRADWEWRLFCMKTLSVPMREIATWGTAVEISLGTPIVYTCLVDYDEVAHRRGPRAPLPMRHLAAYDRSLETIFTAAAAFPEHHYDVYVLADHGMVDAVPFASLDGRDLPAFLRAAADGDLAAARHARMRALGDRLPFLAGWLVHEAARRDASPPDGVAIVDAGDIAHLYFTDASEALTLRGVEALQPRVAAALRAHPGVPFMVARGEHGPVLVHGARTLQLCDETQRAAAAALPAFVGRDARLLLGYLERMASMPSAGDLVLYGNRGPESAVAFSWEMGSHGGIGADEVEAFVIHPRQAGFDFAAVTSPEALHRWFVRYRPLRPACSNGDAR